MGEIQDSLEDARLRGYVDDTEFTEMWLLSERTIGALTNLMIYLERTPDPRPGPTRTRRR